MIKEIEVYADRIRLFYDKPTFPKGSFIMNNRTKSIYFVGLAKKFKKKYYINLTFLKGDDIVINKSDTFIDMTKDVQKQIEILKDEGEK